MRIVHALGDLEPAPQRAVIINCGTKWVTTLALVSTLRHAACPVVVIDCESRDGSGEHFARIAREHGLQFDWLSWPLRRHPAALDALFGEIRDERVLLVDSDAEIRSADVIGGMRQALDADANAYGAGFVHGPEWMGAQHGLPAHAGYYVERMWIPCVLLRAPVVRAALASGASFYNRRLYPVARSEAIGQTMRRIAYAARYWQLRGDSAARFVAPIPQLTGSESPLFIEYDTGADLHYVLCTRGYRLAPPARGDWNDVKHFHGVTRAGVIGRWRALARRLLRRRANDTPQHSILAEVRQRLADDYGIPN